MEKFLNKNEPDNSEIFKMVQHILSIHNENDLEYFIENNEFFKNYCDWEPVGGESGNIRYIGNQQTTAAGTLTEIVVNSIDALLMLECIKSGKDPTESGVPNSMNDAAELFFGISNGRIYNCFPNGTSKLSKSVKTLKGIPITELAGNIELLFLNSDGNNRHKTVIVYDRGTGQAPNDFKDTFLYYKSDNKLNIPFVQGKYGMGGTGIFSRCGLKNYVFILTSKHPDICNPSEINKWAFTIIRKHIGTKREKRDFYEYLCKKVTRKDIFSFTADRIPNALSGITSSKDGKKTKAAPINEMRYGTYMKYYNFELGFTDVRDVEGMFDISLYNPVLPARIDDGTKFKDRGFSWYLIGGNTRFLTRKWINPSYEEGIDIEFTTKHGVKFTGKVLIFKNYIERGGHQTNFRIIDNLSINRSMCVLLTFNGQTHASLDRRFLSQFKYPYIKDKILVVIDFRDIMENHRQLRTKFFTADRERLFENEYTKEFRKTLKSTLESDSILKKINDQYHEEKIEESKVDENFGDYLEEFLRNNEELKAIFQDKAEEFLKLKSNVIKPTKKRKAKLSVKKEEPLIIEEEEIERSEDPRILEWITKKVVGENEIEKKVKTNYKTFLLQLRTDATLGDIIIESHKGIELEPGNREFKEKIWTIDPSKSLSKSILTLTFYPTNKEKVGEKKQISIKLMGKDGNVKNEKIANILFDKPTIREEDTRDDEIEEKITYPNLIPITDNDPAWVRDNWDYDLITKKDGAEIYVNLSSKFLKKYEDKQKKVEHKDNIRDNYKLFTYFYTLFYYWELKEMKRLGGTELNDTDEDLFNTSIKIATVSYLSLWKP